MTAAAIIDTTETSTVVVCGDCNWRTVAWREDEARLLFAEHTRHHDPTTTATTCPRCAADAPLLARVHICPACYRAERAARARIAYHASKETPA